MNKLIGELAKFQQKNKDWLLVSLNSTYQLYNSLIKEFFEYTYNHLGPTCKHACISRSTKTGLRLEIHQII